MALNETNANEEPTHGGRPTLTQSPTVASSPRHILEHNLCQANWRRGKFQLAESPCFAFIPTVEMTEAESLHDGYGRWKFQGKGH